MIQDVMTISNLRSARVTLAPADDGSAGALGGSDTDTFVGMISTSTALRAGAILVCFILPYILRR